MNSVVTICDREDDDVVDSKVLDWAGLWDLWDAHEEILSNYSVVQKILPMCSNVDIETEEWDAGVPGRSGIYFSIETSDEDGLRTELRERIEELIAPAAPRVVPAEEDKVQGIRTRAELVGYLVELAETTRSLRLPGGYGALSDRCSRMLSAAAARLNVEELCGAEIEELLLELAASIDSMKSTSASIRRLAEQCKSLPSLKAL